MGYKKIEAIRMMLQEAGTPGMDITDELLSQIHDSFEKHMLQHYTTTPTLRPIPAAEPVFAALQAAGIRVGLDTGFTRAIADVIVSRLGWMELGLANYLVASNEVEAGRPYPYMIQKLMQLAGLNQASQVVKVGDTEVDVNEGKNAGCLYSIAVTTGAFTRGALQPYKPDFILDDLRELLPILGITPHA
jgi:phosphonatase-like hydrolase